MNQSKISVRYAKALYDFGAEKKILDTLVLDIKTISAALETISELQSFITNPIVNPSDKKRIVQELLGKKVSKETIDFLHLIITNKRELCIQDILRNFLNLYRKNAGITAITITSATELSAAQKSKTISLIETKFKTKVELNETIDSSLLGGFVLRINDLQYDGSVKNKLKLIKQELLAKK